MLTAIVFAGTYLGMAMGRVPGLKIDRTGIALVALALLMVFGGAGRAGLLSAIDAPTLILLFSLMILSAQFGAARLYDACVSRIVGSKASPRRLLAMTVAVVGFLSALLANDIVVFAMTPLLCLGLKARGLDPRPYLLGLAGAANAGSAATLIGNPQNILIGQLGRLDFWQFLGVCGIPAVLSLVIVYGVIAYIWRRELDLPPAQVPGPTSIPTYTPLSPDTLQLMKGLAATLLVLGLFMTGLPREVSALGVAALLLVSRRVDSRDLLQAVDWHLLLLIACLFAITGAFSQTGYPEAAVSWLATHGLLPDRLALLAPLTLLLSNTVGNVPAVTLLLSVWKNLPDGVLYALALLSTLSGNLLLVGSLANLIVVMRARATGVSLSFKDFARAGIPMTLLSLMAAGLWLAAGGWIRLV
jgi:Na+/H+ antiporter NhaD/arsenite permease-like protein